MVALHIPSLQDKAEGADYVIGAMLFLLATFLLFAVVHHFRDSRPPHVAMLSDSGKRNEAGDYGARKGLGRLASLVVIVLLGCAGLRRGTTAFLPTIPKIAQAAVVQFPSHVGNYTLERTWNESLPSGTIVYFWAQYTPPGGGTPIAIGVSPIPDWHDPVLCHSVRGENPIWQGDFRASTAGSVPINFSSALYSDGVTQHVEASTICRSRACGEFATERSHFGFVYSRPDPRSLLSEAPRRPVRVLLRVETTDVSASAESARQSLTQDLRDFLASANFAEMTRPYSD